MSELLALGIAGLAGLAGALRTKGSGAVSPRQTVINDLGMGSYRRRFVDLSVVIAPLDRKLFDFRDRFFAVRDQRKAELLREGLTKSRAHTLADLHARTVLGPAGAAIGRKLPIYSLSKSASVSSVIGSVFVIGAGEEDPDLHEIVDQPALAFRDTNGHRIAFIGFGRNKEDEERVQRLIAEDKPVPEGEFESVLSGHPWTSRINLFSNTSKMSAPSFSLPAGVPAGGGSCVVSSTPAESGKTSICDVCYAKGGAYMYTPSTLSSALRMVFVLQALERDAETAMWGHELAKELVFGITSWARRGPPSSLEIGLWVDGAMKSGQRTRAPIPLQPKEFPRSSKKPVEDWYKVKPDTKEGRGGTYVKTSQTKSGEPGAQTWVREVFEALPGQKVNPPFRNTFEAIRALNPKEGDVVGFFRIHDAGDVTIGTGRRTVALSNAYQNAWREVARSLPKVYFWQPIRAWKLADKGVLWLGLLEKVLNSAKLRNFTVRPSAIHVEDPAPFIEGIVKGKTERLSAGTTANWKIHDANGRLTGRYTFMADTEGRPAFQCPVYSTTVLSEKGVLVEAKSCKQAGCRWCWISKDSPVTYGAH